jgi:hypothetical protein
LEKIENEQHFLLECPLYNTLRHDFIKKVESHHSNFSSLNNSSKFIWLLANENYFKIIYLSVFFSIKAIFKRKINIKLTIVTIQNILFILIPENQVTCFTPGKSLL